MRVGILVNADSVHAYEAAYIEQIKAKHEIVVFEFRCDDPDSVDTKLSTSIWRYWSRAYLYPQMYALRTKLLSDILGDYKPIPVRFVRKGKYSFYAAVGELQLLPEIDVVLGCQYRIVRGSFLEYPKHGVWSFHHDDETVIRGGPSSFWELYYGLPINGAILQRLTDKLDGGQIIRKGWFASDLTSLARTKDKVFFESSQWIQSALNELELKGEILGDISNTNAPIYRDPTNIQMIRLFITIFLRVLKGRIENFFFYEAWNVAITSGHPLDDVDKFQRGMFWLPELCWPFFQADPFWNGRLLLEELNYKENKGAIKEVILDANYKEISRKLLIKSSHHNSYPFTFKDSNGSWKIIPESLQAKVTKVYNADGVATVEMLPGVPIIDPSIIFDGTFYWLFCTHSTPFTDGCAQLFIYYAEDVKGPFNPHLLNPVKSDIRSSRPGGSFFEYNGKLYRPAQDCSKTYGGALKIQRIDKLTPTEFVERSVLLLNPVAPYSRGLHHLAIMDDKFLVDGKRNVFSLKRIFWNVLRKQPLLPTIPNTITTSMELYPASWEDVCVSRGVYSDGWCQRHFKIAVDIKYAMNFLLEVEYPGWQANKNQLLRITTGKSYRWYNIKQGVHILTIPLNRGVQQIDITARSKFKMPSPDVRTCTLSIRSLRLLKLDNVVGNYE